MIITRHSTHQLAVAFRYHKATKDAVKRVAPGATFDPPTKLWFAPLPAFRHLIAAFPTAQYDAALPAEVAAQCAEWFYESLRGLGVELAFAPDGQLAAANLPTGHVLQDEVAKRTDALFELMMADERQPRAIPSVTVQPEGEATAVEHGIVNAGKRAQADERRRQWAGKRHRKQGDQFTQGTLLDLLGGK